MTQNILINLKTSKQENFDWTFRMSTNDENSVESNVEMHAAAGESRTK